MLGEEQIVTTFRRERERYEQEYMYTEMHMEKTM